MIAPTVDPPFLRLSGELFHYILLLAKETDQNIPVVFCQITTYLRQLTMNSPLLWNHVDVQYGSVRASAYLQRSSPVPLDVSLSLPPAHDRPSGVSYLKAFVLFVALFVPHANRIRSLTAVNTHGPWTDVAIAFLQEFDCRNLEVLDLGLTSSSADAAEVHGRIEALGGIRELTLREVQILPAGVPSFERITKLEVVRSMTSTFEELLHIISQMSTLRDPVLSDMYRAPVDMVFRPPATTPPPFPSLQTIELTRLGCAEMQGVFSLVANTPNVESLALTSIRPGSLDPKLVHFLRSHPTILDLRMTDCNPQDWGSLFPALPSLTHLHIAFADITDKDLDNLAPTEITNIVCPSLTHLTLLNTLETTSETIKDIVLARAQTPVPIKALVLRGWDAEHIKEEDVVVIRDLVTSCDLEVFEAVGLHGDEGEAGSSDEEGWDSASFTSGDRVIINGELGWNN